MLTDDEAHVLLRRVASQDESAFSHLVDSLLPFVERMARNVLRNEADANEVVNDVFMAVWSQASTFEARGGSRVKTWVLGIARFKSLEFWRNHKRHGLHEDIDELSDTLAGESEIPGGENWLVADALRRCANALEPRHRRILELRSVDGFTNVEVGQLLGKPEGSIKRLHHEACKLMQQCLGKGGFGHPLTS